VLLALEHVSVAIREDIVLRPTVLPTMIIGQRAIHD
jgi:Ni,Fe-hydrogenase I cytochrome b subunit